MIKIIIWGEDFEQDIRPLIKAFYPGAEFQVTKKEWTAARVHSADEFADCLQGMEKNNALCSQPDSDVSVSLTEWDYAFLLYQTEGYMAVKCAEQIHKAQFSDIAPDAERRVYKDSLMRALYGILQKVTHTSLPWGIMTGIRPTKQVLERLEAGEPEDRIRAYMKEEYLCTDEKISTSLTVAAREHVLLKELEKEDGYSLYIGIPFCPSTCYYCSFTSYPLGVYGKQVENYLEALFKEIRFAGKAIPNKVLQTVYFGGGTPTTLSAEQLDCLFTEVEQNFDLSHVR